MLNESLVPADPLMPSSIPVSHGAGTNKNARSYQLGSSCNTTPPAALASSATLLARSVAFGVGRGSVKNFDSTGEGSDLIVGVDDGAEASAAVGATVGVTAVVTGTVCVLGGTCGGVPAPGGARSVGV